MAIKTLKQLSDEAREQTAVEAVAARGDVEQPFIAAARANIDRARETEPDWLIAARERALTAFERLGFPHKRVEEWKYTDLRQKLSGGDASLSHSRDRQTGAHAGVQGLSINAITTGNADTWKSLIEAVTQSGTLEINPMAALSFALSPQIICIRVEKGASPSELDLNLTEDHTTETVLGDFKVLELGEGATLSIVEDQPPARAKGLRNDATMIRLGQGANLTHLAIDDGGARLAVHTRMIQMDADATYDATFAQFGGGTTRNEIRIEMNGAQASANLRGAYLLAGDDHCDTTTVIDHNVPDCTSNQTFKGVLNDTASAAYQGKVIVAKDAQRTDAKQLSKTLLLSNRCEINAKPELMIFADDVQCAHGATSGDIDSDQLFYLRARGIPEKEARRLLIEAFLNDIFEGEDNEHIRTKISRWLGEASG